MRSNIKQALSHIDKPLVAVVIASGIILFFLIGMWFIDLSRYALPLIFTGLMLVIYGVVRNG